MPEIEFESTLAGSVKVDATTGKETTMTNQPSEERAVSSRGRGDASSQRQHQSGGGLPDQVLEHREVLEHQDQACYLVCA